MDTTYFIPIKTVVIGDIDAGKSSLILRYTEDKFIDTSPNFYRLDFRNKLVETKFDSYGLQIWNTQGPEYFKHSAKLYFKDASFVIL